MATFIPSEMLGLGQAIDAMEKTSIAEYTDALQEVPGELRARIEDGTATLDEIEAFLQQTPPINDDLKSALLELLLVKQGWLLVRANRLTEALQTSNKALKNKAQSTTGWTLKSAALVGLERFEEACQAFNQAYLLKSNLGTHQVTYPQAIIKGWSGCALLWGLQGIIQLESKTAQAGVEEYLRVLDHAKAEHLENSVMAPSSQVTPEFVPEELQDALEELDVMVRLLSIKDPFDGWRALTKEISKDWPKDVSAVDAIREQRDRPWNT